MPALTPVTLPTSKTDASFAVAISSSGQVAGTIENEHGVRRAVLYRKDMVELGTLGGSDSYAGGINHAGDVVGTAQNADGYWRAFVAPAARAGNAPAMRDLGTLGGRSSHGAAINDAGQVVGFADTADGTFHALSLIHI